MANATPVSICPKCEAELVYPIPAKCPKCEMTLIKSKNKHFEDMDYIVYQLEDHKDRLGIDKEKPALAEDIKEWEEVQIHMKKFLIEDCSPEDKIACLQDARSILKHLILANHTGEQIHQIVALAKSIGEIATAIDAYARTGGELNDKSGPVPT